MNTGFSEKRTRTGTAAGYIGILCNAVLFAAKFAAGMMTGSVAVTADAFNNLSDAGASVVTLLGFKLAAKPADSEHPFGHGRSEYVSSLVISFMILAVGVTFLQTSVQRIIAPDAVEYSLLSVVILAGSMIVKLFLMLLFRRAGKRIESGTLLAASQDSLNDIAVTGVTLASIIASRFISVPIDGYIGTAVSLFVMFGGYKIARETLSTLLGQPADPKLVEQIKKYVLEDEQVYAIHDLVVHNYGPGRIMASVHVEIPETTDILKAHDRIDMIERCVLEELKIPLVIHMDPIDLESEKTNEMRSYIYGAIREIEPQLSAHDFRMVAGDTHSNLIFDITVPMCVTLTNAEIKKKLDAKLCAEFDEKYFTVITFDKSFL